MKILRKTNKKKIILITIVVILILAATITTVIFRERYNKSSTLPSSSDSNGVDYNPPTEEQKEAVQQTSPTTKNSPNDGSRSDYPASTGSSVAIEITALNKKDKTLQVRTLIQTIAPGSCLLTLSKDGETTITKKVNTQIVSNYSTCKGFDINTTGLSGEWQLKIAYSSTDAKRSGNVSQEVSL